MGVVLSQNHDDEQKEKPQLHPIAYYSATFSPVERNYNIYKRKLLAIMKALGHWQPYLGWTKEPFTVLTDHANLQYWKVLQNLTRHIARWHANLHEYDYVLKYIPGVASEAHDCPSPNPAPPKTTKFPKPGPKAHL